MKKSTYLLTLLLTALFCLPWGSKVWAYDPVTVADGTNTNSYVPIYGNWADAYQHFQVIYPATDLAGMAGKQITSMKFYISTSSSVSKVWNGTYTIRLAETESTYFSDAFIEVTSEPVYSGSLDGRTREVLITFTDPYVYNGGNLLFDLQDETYGDNYNAASFYGVGQASNTAIGSYSSSSVADVAATGRAFIPKTTFTYETPATCKKPSNLLRTAVSANSASFSWAAGASETQWQYLCLPADEEPDWASASVKTATSVSATVDGLTPQTSYKFYVRANCGGADGQSAEVSVDFKTSCVAVSSLPWNDEDFADVTTGSSVYNIPDCWNRIAYESWYGTMPYVQNGSSGHSGSGSRYLYFYGGQTPAAIILPAFAEKTGKLAVSFWYKSNTYAYYGDVQIGYMTDPTDASSFTLLKTLDKVTDWTFVNAFAMAGAPDNSYIAIRFAGGTSDYCSLYIDDISVDLAPSCVAPGVPSASNITTNSAELTWGANSGETAWKLQYSTDGETWSAEQAVSDNPYTLPHLTSNTLYYVRVKAVCSGSDESVYSEIGSFRTACGTMAALDEKFDTYSASSRPACWEWITYNDGWDDYPMVSASNAFSGSNSLAFSGGGSAATATFAVLPKFEDPINTLALWFYYKNSSTYASYAQLKVGYMLDPAIAGTFVEVATLGKTTDYTKVGPFTFSEAPTDAYIAIQFGGGSSNYGAAYIDNVVVAEAPSCIQPGNLSASSITDEGAVISWNAGGSENNWILQYKRYDGDWSADIPVASTPSYTLTGLEANTNYYVRVKAICAGSDESDWANSVMFKTACGTNSLGWSETFDSSTMPDCWIATSASATYKWYMDYEYVSSSYNYYVRLRTGSSGTATLQLPPIDLSTDAVLKFKWKSSSSPVAPVKLYISTDGGTTKTLITPDDLTNTYSSWTDKTYDLSDYTGNTAIIYFISTFSAASKYAFLDDVQVIAKPCDLLTNVKVQPTMDGGTVTWTGDAKKLQYRAGSTGEWTAVAIAEADKAKPYTLTGLAASTSYQVRALSVCGDENDEAAWTAPVSFTTKCAPSDVLPYENDFESETSNNNTLPACWGKITTSDSYPQVAQGSLAYGGSGNFLQFSGSEEQIAILPAFAADLSTLTIQFFYRYHYADFQLGYVKADGATFVPIETLTQSAAYGEAPYEKDLASIPADAVYLALRMTNASSLNAQACVDNLVVKVTPACAKPTNLSVSAITAEGATFSWEVSEKANETQYQYCVVASGAAPSDWTLLGEDVRTVAVTGKAAHTAYDFYVRSYCGSSEQSETVKLSFTTACAVISALPWEHDFESDETFDIPECWDALDNSGTSYVLGSNGHNAAKCLFVEEGRTTNFQTVILPKFAAELGTLYISFWYKGSAGANYGKVQAGYITDATDQNSFVPVGEAFAPVAEYQNAEVPFTGVTADARIALRYAGGTTDGELYIDDIRVAVVSACARPADLAAVATSDGATLTWTDDAASEWTVRYSVKDANSWTEAEHIAATNHTLSGLTTGTTYEVQVKAICGVGSESDWSEKALFTPVCNLPTDLTVVSTTQTSARITWESLESSWNLQYKAAADAEWLSVNGLTSKDYLLVGLTAGTAYQVRVQAVCGGETFTAPVSFTTKCAPSDVLPYENDFESETVNLLPACWSKVPEGEYPKVLSGSASYGGEGKCLCFFGASEQLVVLPAFTEPMANLSISFFYRNSTSSLEIGYVESDFVTFHKLADLDNLAAYGASVFEMSLAAAPAEAASIAIRFTGTNAYSSLAYFDNLRVRKTPNCAKPTDVVAGSINSTSASISWTSAASAWNLQYKTGSADWTTVAISENPYTLTSLAQGAAYQVRVQADCGGGDLSDWSDEASFTTSCSGIAELPYIADFSHALSNCWIIFAEDETDYKPMANTTMNQLTMNGGKNGSSNNVVVMPPFSADLSKAAMSFEYKGTVGNNYAQLEVGYLTDKSDKETFTALATLDQANTWTEARVDLASLPNSAYLAFRYAGATSQGDMAIRNLRILEQLTLADNADNSATLNAHLNKAVDVTIGRTLFCDGDYNTICLPFSLPTLEGTPLEGAILKAYKYAVIEPDELQVRVIDAESIVAGTPYLIKFAEGENIVDPLFTNVTITATTGSTIGQGEPVAFRGVLVPQPFDKDDETTLFVHTGNTLTWSGKEGTSLKSFRAFFQRTPASSGAPLRYGMRARIVEQEETATGINDVQTNTIQSIKLLENDQVVIIRNGVKYNVQGQVIEREQ